MRGESPACRCILSSELGFCLPMHPRLKSGGLLAGKHPQRGEGWHGACFQGTRAIIQQCAFPPPRRTSKGMRIRPEGTGPANWTSSCPWWGMQWGWAMSGGFPTWPSRTGEVWLFQSFGLRRGGVGICGAGVTQSPGPEGEVQDSLLTLQLNCREQCQARGQGLL